MLEHGIVDADVLRERVADLPLTAARKQALQTWLASQVVPRNPTTGKKTRRAPTRTKPKPV